VIRFIERSISVPRHQSAGNRERLVQEHQARYCLDAAIRSGSHSGANPDEAAQFRHT